MKWTIFKKSSVSHTKKVFHRVQNGGNVKLGDVEEFPTSNFMCAFPSDVRFWCLD